MEKSYWCEWEASFKQQVIAEHTDRDWQHAAWEVFDIYRYLVKPSDVPHVKNNYRSVPKRQMHRRTNVQKLKQGFHKGGYLNS